MADYKLVPAEIIDRLPEINTSNYGHDDVCDLNACGVELVLAAVDAPDVQGDPFMYGIASPDGRPHFGENCVSSEAHTLFEEVDSLNSDDVTGYRVIALYAAPQPAEQQPFEWPDPDAINQMAFEEGQPAEDGDGYLFTQEEFDLFVERLTSAVTQHPAPSVSRLVEALERVAIKAEALDQGGDGCDDETARSVAADLRCLIAAHRKGG